ncbi:MAG: hypothetical protein AUJ76_00735 [Candidatus Omnitrophica bacterium CG1_02_41_171]|nr:MAG: hypothetical protein AUJ76_00735 [Candidatus Omnitrophica bacterium CG1_02_41_171]
MKIIISKHARSRMITYNFTEDLIKNAVLEPDEVVNGYGGTLIAQKLLNGYLLRVVYRKQKDEIKIITVYPAKKARYWREK